MSSTFRKTVVSAVAMMVTMAPLVFAQTSGSGASSSAPSDKPAATGHMGTGTTGTHSSQMGNKMGTMGAHEAMHATIADMDQQRNTLKLKMQSGETVEFKVPERSMTNLQKGDSVQVSIRKADAATSTTDTMSQPRPSTSAPSTSTPGSGTTGSGTQSR